MKLYLLMCSLTVFVHSYEHYKDTRGHNHIADDTCTATWIAKDKLLTAGHCMSETIGQHWIMDWEKEHVQVKVTAVDYQEDIAILQTVIPFNHKYARFGKRARPLSPIYMTSFEDDMVYVYGEGKVVGLWTNEDVSLHSFLASNMLSSPGSSGAAWFNEDGEIVGLHVRTDKIGSYAVDIPTIQEFLDKHKHEININ